MPKAICILRLVGRLVWPSSFRPPVLTVLKDHVKSRLNIIRKSSCSSWTSIALSHGGSRYLPLMETELNTTTSKLLFYFFLPGFFKSVELSIAKSTFRSSKTLSNSLSFSFFVGLRDNLRRLNADLSFIIDVQHHTIYLYLLFIAILSKITLLFGILHQI